MEVTERRDIQTEAERPSPSKSERRVSSVAEMLWPSIAIHIQKQRSRFPEVESKHLDVDVELNKWTQR